VSAVQYSEVAAHRRDIAAASALWRPLTTPPRASALASPSSRRLYKQRKRARAGHRRGGSGISAIAHRLEAYPSIISASARAAPRGSARLWHKIMTLIKIKRQKRESSGMAWRHALAEAAAARKCKSEAIITAKSWPYHNSVARKLMRLASRARRESAITSPRSISTSTKKKRKALATLPRRASERSINENIRKSAAA